MVVAVVAALAVGGRWRAVFAAPAGLLGAVSLTALNQGLHPGAYTPLNDLVFFVALVGAPLLVGVVWRVRGLQLAQLDELLTQRRAQRAAELRLARLEEQTRIAAQVHHDVIQAMGGIAVRSAGAARGGETQLADALTEVETSARGALDALRAHIGVLREPVPDEPDVAVSAAAPWPVPRMGPTDLLAAGAAVPLAVESVAGAQRHGPVYLTLVLALLLAVPLAIRRRHPVMATGLGFGLAAVMSLVATAPAATVSAIIPALLLAYGVGAYPRSWQGRGIGLGVLWSGTTLVGLSTPPALRDPAGYAPTLAWTGLAVLGGVLAAGRAARVRRRAALLADIDQGRQAELRLAAAEQRHAVARDLHDSVAAAMTVICLHAAAARRQLGADAAAVRAALDTVQSTARSGIAELRASLDVLEGAATDDEPALLALEAVIEAARATGMTLHLDLESDRLAGDSGLLVTRIVREALVNAARHAPGSAVTIRVVRCEDELRVRVSDTGPGRTCPAAPNRGTGHGLLGLSERVRAAGGAMSYGSTGRGFEVSAALPLDSAGHPVAVQAPRGGDQVLA